LEKWSVLASDFLKAKDDQLKLIEFRQQALCAPWEESAKTSRMQKDSFQKSEYPKGTPPPDTYKLVAGIDLQHDRYYFVVLAYTRSKKVYLVDYGMPKFDSENPYDSSSIPFELEQRIYPGNFEIEMEILDTGDQTLVAKNIIGSLSKGLGIKGTPNSRYTNQFLSRSKDSDVMLCPLQETNNLLDTLILSKQFLIPSDTGDKDEILTHLTNVVKRNNKYVDKTVGARTDYRDASRYALAYMFYCEYSKEIDRDTYLKVNQKAIEAQQKQNLENLAAVFSGTF